MRCTIVWEYNAGESALYDESGKKVTECRDTLESCDAEEHGCEWVTRRQAVVDGDACAIYECEEIRGWDYTEWDCVTVWPEQLDESWLIPHKEH